MYIANNSSVFKFMLRNAGYGFSPDAIITAPNNGMDNNEMCELIQAKIDMAKELATYDITDYDIDKICVDNGWNITWLEPVETYDGLLNW